MKTQWNSYMIYLEAMKDVNLVLFSLEKVGTTVFSCNTSRFSHDFCRLGIWPLCFAQAKNQAVGIKKALCVNVPGRDLVCKKLPVSSACKLQALQVQCHGKSSTSSHFFLCTSTSFYIIVYLQSLLTPSGIFKHTWLWPLCTMKPREACNVHDAGLLAQMHILWYCHTSAENGWCFFLCQFLSRLNLQCLLRLLCKKTRLWWVQIALNHVQNWLWSKSKNNSAFLDVANTILIHTGRQPRRVHARDTCKKAVKHIRKRKLCNEG